MTSRTDGVLVGGQAAQPVVGYKQNQQTGAGSAQQIMQGPEIATAPQSGGRAPYVGIVNSDGSTQGYTGKYKIEGQTIDANAAVSARVLLFPASAPGTCIAEVLTTVESGGAFEFVNIAPGQYIVEAIDPLHTENNPLRAWVTAVAM